jgi:hypothetical protein
LPGGEACSIAVNAKMTCFVICRTIGAKHYLNVEAILDGSVEIRRSVTADKLDPRQRVQGEWPDNLIHVVDV